MNEHQLIEQCRKRDRDAQHELYARTSDRVYRVLLRMTGNPEDASELAQETYFRVFRSIGEFKGTASVGTWIYQIAVNEARQFFRRRKRREEVYGEVNPHAESSVHSDQDTVRMDIEEALGRLPEAERTLIILRHFEELSYDEMAEVLEKPAGTIASGLNRARQMLRDRLGQDFQKMA